jgi:hypothetical protein
MSTTQRCATTVFALTLTADPSPSQSQVAESGFSHMWCPSRWHADTRHPNRRRRRPTSAQTPARAVAGETAFRRPLSQELEQRPRGSLQMVTRKRDLIELMLGNARPPSLPHHLALVAECTYINILATRGAEKQFASCAVHGRICTVGEAPRGRR